MSLSHESRVKHELHHSKTTRITTHALGMCPLTVLVYNEQKFWESFKKILKKKALASLQVFIPSTDLVKNTGLKLSWKYGQKGFASQLVTCLKDTKKLDGNLHTMTIVVPSESLFKEFSQQSESNWFRCLFQGFGTSHQSPEKVDRSSTSTVGAIKITASKMEAVELAFQTVTRTIFDTLNATDTKESGGALASSIDEEYVLVDSEVDNLNSNEQEDEASGFTIPFETDRSFMTLMKENLAVKGLLKPNQLYHPDHEVIVLKSPSDAARAKETLAKFKPESLPTNLSRNTTLALRQEENEKIDKKDFKFATGITLTEDATHVHGNFVQIIAAHRFLDEMFSSATSKVVVSKQTPTHKNTKDLDKMEEMSGIQFRAAMHLIGTSEVETAVSKKHGSAEQISLLFHDNAGANQLKQRILGFNTETVEIHGKINTNEDMALKEVMHDNKVYAELSPDSKSVVIISEEWNEQSAAKKKIQVKFGQVKASSRAKRTFAENTSKHLVVNNPLEHSSTPEQRIDQPDNQVFKVGSVSVLVYSADITTLKVDAIVNAANGNLSHGSGVARAIRDAAGDALDVEGRQYVHNNGPIPVSGVVRTTAGRMPCRMVLHAVGPAWYDYKDYEKVKCEDDLCKTILRCLIEATNAGAAKVAIPAISSGIFRVPKQKCCDAYVRATKLFGMWTGSKRCLTEVHFVDKSESMLHMIATTFSQSKLSTITPRPDEERFMKQYMHQEVRRRSRSRGRQTSSSLQGGQTILTVSESHAVSAVEASYTYSVDGKGVVKLYTGDIVKTSADVLVTWKNTDIQPITGASKAVGEATGHINLQGLKKDLLCVSSTHAGNMRDKKHIIHAIVPVSSLSLSDLETLLTRILNMVCGTDTSTALTPLTSKQVNLEDFAKAFCNITREVMKESRVPEIHLIEKNPMVIAKLKGVFDSHLTLESGEDTMDIEVAGATGGEECSICKDSCNDPKTLKCGHRFCSECIDHYFNNYKPVCPNCGAIHGPVSGNMPEGKMSVTVNAFNHLLGHPHDGTITIRYNIPGGIQKEEHPNPGKPYMGAYWTAYLPDSWEGKKVLRLLIVAFDRRLTFTVGRSVTTGAENKVTWNDIHHKTSYFGNFGYPDPGYLKRVQEELAAKGVTEADIDWSTPV
ncbi:uncharacterized protein LOC124267270 [Haliotis rubra]|uniref:uncharacterized protein LOC124267270 n=1 Tax=Haliotis rubra TaxID=36100 RepID=UPI001EE60D56|nr:uncharacterized protein LOC124267270 [Haliotis rubra]